MALEPIASERYEYNLVKTENRVHFFGPTESYRKIKAAQRSVLLNGVSVAGLLLVIGLCWSWLNFLLMIPLLVGLVVFTIGAIRGFQRGVHGWVSYPRVEIDEVTSRLRVARGGEVVGNFPFEQAVLELARGNEEGVEGVSDTQCWLLVNLMLSVPGEDRQIEQRIPLYGPGRYAELLEPFTELTRLGRWREVIR